MVVPTGSAMQQARSLDDLLRRCTVGLGRSGESGTGFFVGPGLILTCAHVVEKAQASASPVEVYWGAHHCHARIQKCLPKPYPDLALLNVEFSDHPCVYLDQTVDINDGLYSYGYTEDYPGGDSASFVYEGPTGGPQPLLKLKVGQASPGMSGSPLLNTSTGGVCGVLKTSRDIHSDLGGRAIPTSTILSELGELKALQSEYHEQNRFWLVLRRWQQDPTAAYDASPHVEAIRRKAKENLPLRRFVVPIRKYASMENLLTRPESGELVPSLVDLILRESGPFLLHGAGGSGKTYTLRRLVEDFHERGAIPVLVDAAELGRWKDMPTKFSRENLRNILDYLLLKLPLPVTVDRFLRFRGEVLLLVDGLNEASGGKEEESRQAALMDAIQYARVEIPNLSVIIGDRFHLRPEARTHGYARLRMEPLDGDQVRGLVAGYDDLPDSTREILRDPFFLDYWLKRDDPSGPRLTKADMLKDALISRGNLDESGLAKLARSAYGAYQKGGSKYVDADQLEPFREKLLASGLVVHAGSRETDTGSGSREAVMWSHELFHDYLAARHLVKSQEVEWSEDGFDAITLSRQSYEAIQLAVEQLPPADRERFLVQVYDWSYIAAAVCLAEEERLALTDGMTEEIRRAIVAGIAEKQFDVFPHTQATATRTLRQLPRELRHGYLRGEGLATETEMRERVAGIGSKKDWFRTWQSLFTKARAQTISGNEVKTLVDRNSVIGWAAANLLRRGDLDDTVWLTLQMVLKAFRDRTEGRSIRWRIVHVLGKGARMEVVAELLECLADEYDWVKYGAVRSLVEISWLRPELRELVLRTLEDRVHGLPTTCRFELARALSVGSGHREWVDLCARLIEAIQVHGEDRRVNWDMIRRDLENSV